MGAGPDGGPSAFRAGTTPAISVVIPTHERDSSLAACLTAMAAQCPDEPFEVLVVDDGGSVPLDALVDGFRESLDVRLVRVSHGGAGSARNQGAARAGGALLAFTDDDCRPEPGWLAALLAAHRRRPEAALGGPTENAVSGNRYSEATELLMRRLRDGFRERPEGAGFFSSNNLAVPADDYRAVMGFDAGIGSTGEDRVFCDAWRASGRPLVYVPDALVRHAHPLGLATFIELHFRYGAGSLRARLRPHEKPRPAHFRRPGFYLDLVTAPFRAEPLARAFVLSTLVALSQAAVAGGYLWGVLVAAARSRGRTAR